MQPAASAIHSPDAPPPPASLLGRQTDGGCCDCGDSGAWDPKGFCSKHGRLQTIPDLLGSIPEAILPSAQVAYDPPRRPPPADTHTRMPEGVAMGAALPRTNMSRR